MRLRLSISTAILLALAAPAAAQPRFDREAWRADYERLKVAIANDYANLDWQVQRRGLNLVSADRFITAMLDRAQDDTAATLAIARLVDVFKDPHLALAAGPPPKAATRVPRSSAVDGPAALSKTCTDSGYQDGATPTRLPYPRAPGWTPVSEGPFAAGLIGDTGIVRIPEFGEDRYLAACRAAARPGMDGRALQLATRAELNRQLAALIATLKSRGMKRLAIDITRNGGGTEWDAEVAAMLATGPLNRETPRRTGAKCDRSGMWAGEAPPCPVYAEPASTEESRGTPAWTGPLAILADRRTASAAEEFIVWLRGNGKAVVAGERTSGAGCGYMDGGAAFAFTAVPMHLMMPNCSRFTADGINEIEGQSPDLPVDWTVLEPAAVQATLDRLFALLR